MSGQYKICTLFWIAWRSDCRLSNMGTLEKLLNDGWEIVRMDAIPPVETAPDTACAANVYILEKGGKEGKDAKTGHDEPKTMHSHERLEHERRKAWREGYASGWKDQECDFPQYTSENPYKETNE